MIETESTISKRIFLKAFKSILCVSSALQMVTKITFDFGRYKKEKRKVNYQCISYFFLFFYSLFLLGYLNPSCFYDYNILAFIFRKNRLKSVMEEVHDNSKHCQDCQLNNDQNRFKQVTMIRYPSLFVSIVSVFTVASKVLLVW